MHTNTGRRRNPHGSVNSNAVSQRAKKKTKSLRGMIKRAEIDAYNAAEYISANPKRLAARAVQLDKIRQRASHNQLRRPLAK